MTNPTVHLNGTSRADLIEDYANMTSALREAERVLVAGSPNARDYYPQGPAAFSSAVKEHEARVAKIRSVREELEAVIDALLEAR